MDMPTRTQYFGWALLGLGFGGYFVSEQASVTALIPAAFGLALVLLGFAGAKTASSKHPMHAAAALALLGFVGSAGGLLDLLALATGGDVERPLAALSRSAMAVLLATFVALCVRSFRQARAQSKQS